MNTQLPLNQRIDKTKLEKHPSGDGWLVPTREGGKAWVLSFSGKGAKPIIGDEINYYPDGKYWKTEEDGDLMLDAYVDPHAELKAAHAAGKVIQSNYRLNPEPCWVERFSGTPFEPQENCEYRIKPEWTLADHMRRFFPTWDEATMPLHRNDFTQDMLPDGWRPLLLEEIYVKDDEWIADDKPRKWSLSFGTSGNACWKEASFSRTRRPLPEVKKPVPLGPEDVKCGDLLSSDPENYQVMITHKGPHSVSCPDCGMNKVWRFQELKDSNMKISRDGGKTWEACSK